MNLYLVSGVYIVAESPDAAQAKWVHENWKTDYPIHLPNEQAGGSATLIKDRVDAPLINPIEAEAMQLRNYMIRTEPRRQNGLGKYFEEN